MGIGYIVFGNVDSRNYNITVAFKDVDHTPKRVYQHIAIPGRNGEFYLDEKRFEDVPVSYDCIALDDDDRKSFVNALAAQTGHVRLEDTFNVGEFYSAVFEGDVDPYVTQDRENSTFTIHFTRKPQRWLKSGETAVSIADGDTLTNPTLHASSPLLEMEGYGDISFNGYNIGFDQVDTGNVIIGRTSNSTVGGSRVLLTNTNMLNDGDVITFNDFTPTITGSENCSAYLRTQLKTSEYPATSRIYGDITSSSCTGGSVNATASVVRKPSSGTYFCVFAVTVWFAPNTELVYGVPSTKSATATATARYLDKISGNNETITVNQTVTATYDGDHTISISQSTSVSGGTYFNFGIDSANGITANATAYSTKPMDFGSIFCDCDIGEFYRVEDGQYISMNHVGDLGSDLPKLASGDNTFEYSDTFTLLKVTPRWWKL